MSGLLVTIRAGAVRPEGAGNRRGHRRTGTVVLALTVGLAAACGPAGRQAEDPNWQLVQAYLTLDAAWHAAEPRGRGDHPPIELAVAAARAIVADAAHPQLTAAAEFLIEHPYGMTPTAREDIDLGVAALAAAVGPNWDVIEDYERAVDAWQEERTARAAAAAESGEAEGSDDGAAPPERPSIVAAMAAATAIAAQDGHRQQQAAAEFLVMNSARMQASGRFALEGVNALLAWFPNCDWPALLPHLYDLPERAQLDRLLEALIDRAEDPALRASARYYLAASLMRAANDFGIAAADLDQRRERALAVATGLSAGVEAATMARPDQRGPDGAPLVTTLAEAEQALLFRINHATAGGTLPAATGRRLDGVEEGLDRFAGRMVLVDFWATWCAPCIRALPTLRELHAQLRPERFAMLAVSVDAELQTVVEFQQDEPMPWDNWHVGDASDLAQAWEVRAFPTYILVDGGGRILARTNTLSPRFVAFIRERVADAAAA